MEILFRAVLAGKFLMIALELFASIQRQDSRKYCKSWEMTQPVYMGNTL